MRVLIWVPEVGAPFGGHTVQMKMTAESLKSAGHDVTYSTSTDLERADIDIVHGLGLTTQQIRQVREQRIPVCLSTIYWSKAYRHGELQPRTPRERLELRLRRKGSRIKDLVKPSRILTRLDREPTLSFESAELLLPNSHAEAAQIKADLEITTPMRIVPNAVDPSLFSITTEWSDRLGALYVGRIEPHKNQLRLIEALAETGIQLLIVGDAHPHHPEYTARVREAAEAAPNVVLMGPVPHDELAEQYNRVRVHVCPSGFETTGLVSLEAALCGCNVVSTGVGYASAYLGGDAWYCDPYDIASIRSAVTRAHTVKPDGELRERILSNYTWEHAAGATEKAYGDLIALST